MVNHYLLSTKAVVKKPWVASTVPVTAADSRSTPLITNATSLFEVRKNIILAAYGERIGSTGKLMISWSCHHPKRNDSGDYVICLAIGMRCAIFE